MSPETKWRGSRSNKVYLILDAVVKQHPRAPFDMRILLIADIHGNWPALQAVAAEPHDLCLCVGDLVDYGLEPGPVVDWVRENARYAVRGNHDHGAAQNVLVHGKAGFKYLTGVDAGLDPRAADQGRPALPGEVARLVHGRASRRRASCSSTPRRATRSTNTPPPTPTSGAAGSRTSTSTSSASATRTSPTSCKSATSSSSTPAASASRATATRALLRRHPGLQGRAEAHRIPHREDPRGDPGEFPLRRGQGDALRDVPPRAVAADQRPAPRVVTISDGEARMQLDRRKRPAFDPLRAEKSALVARNRAINRRRPKFCLRSSRRLPKMGEVKKSHAGAWPRGPIYASGGWICSRLIGISCSPRW